MMKFNELNLSKEVLDATLDMGFEEMSVIQERSIPVLMAGQDIIGQSQTGSGKTAAFSIPILENCRLDSKNVQAMILCPTRELSMQVAEEVKKLGKYKKGLRVLPIYGGQPINRQISELKRGVHVVVGTPGRLIDHIKRGTINLSQVKFIVLDEADEMFDMGFREDMEFILGKLSDDRQTVFFSATMDKDILKFAKRYQRQAEIIKVKSNKNTLPKIKQSFYKIKASNKFDVLTRVIDYYEPKLSVVFCNTKRGVDNLVDKLIQKGYFADGLHGDLKQGQRDNVMNKFRRGNISILVATDVAARGIDVNDVDMVINYDMPEDVEYYVHRIGRTARAGREGMAFNFVTGRDMTRLKNIEKYTKKKIDKADIPTRAEVEGRKMESLMESIASQLDASDIDSYRKLISKNNQMDLLDFSAGLLKLYLDKEESMDREMAESTEVSRLYVNLGKKMGVNPNHILAGIMENVKIESELVGKIDIFDTFSFFEIPKSKEEATIRNMTGSKIRGRVVRVERANSKSN